MVRRVLIMGQSVIILPLRSKNNLARATSHVLRLASVLLRLRRATGIETALFELATEDSRKHERRPSCKNLGGAADLAERNRPLLRAVQESDAAEETRSVPMRRRLSRTVSCAWQICRLAPHATAEPFNLSLFVPATRARRLVRRVQVTLARSIAERAITVVAAPARQLN